MNSQEWMKLQSKLVRPHNRVAQLMLNGEIVSPEEIETFFYLSEEKTKRGTDLVGLVQRRLSVYIFDIRKYDNGVVKVYRDGKRVGGYQLVNHDQFDMEGRWLEGTTRTALADAEVDSWGVAETPSPTPVEAVDEDLPLPFPEQHLTNEQWDEFELKTLP